MEKRKVWAVWFSGTGTTEKTVRRIASGISAALALPLETYDYTLKPVRERGVSFSDGDVVVWGSPVYAGRVPNVLLPYLKEKVHAVGALAVPVVLFGNRSYDDALMELTQVLTADGFTCVAGAAFVGEHAFSDILGAGRPNEGDMQQMDGFAAAVSRKLLCGDNSPVTVGGCDPIRPYYTPRDRNNAPINILKVKPRTDMAKCTHCGWCAAHCPMGSIDPADPSAVTGICIKCCACVKGCPSGAKYYDDAGYLYHRHELEEMYARAAEPALFVGGGYDHG